MDWNRVEGNWKQIKGRAKEKWGLLTDSDLNVINGRRDQLEGKIQDRYGYAKDQARREVDEWYAAAIDSPGSQSVTNSLTRGKEAIGAAAGDATDQAATDLKALRVDLNHLTETVTKFISQAGNEAAKSAREITSNIAGQMSNVAGEMADRGANIAAATTQQAKTFATELENVARRNPLGAIAGAVMVGVLIGMMGRRNG